MSARPLGRTAVSITPIADASREKLDTLGEKVESFTISRPRSRVDDLQPEGLRLSTAEREFLPLLGPLLPTPRSAKRLVNLYRLLRIGIPETDLPAFVGGEDGGPYQAAAVLLATVIGLPADVRGALRALRDANPGEDVVSFLRSHHGHPTKARPQRIPSTRRASPQPAPTTVVTS
jgi:hypothetical protein